MQLILNSKKMPKNKGRISAPFVVLQLTLQGFFELFQNSWILKR
jgi:hypothetical protein